MSLENEKKVGKITEILLDKYVIEDNDGKRYISGIRGNIKKKSNVLVGDFVEFEESYDNYIITDIKTRKNQIIRPPVANIDNLVIVLSVSNPEPDYILLDKELLLCYQKNIHPVICINKIDLENDGVISYINNTYRKLGIDVVYTSVTENKGIEELLELIRGKTSAFSGNSGVGKSSLTKLVLKDENIQIGDIGEKTSKGKHTTKHVKLYSIEKGTYLLDTPGFSSYELYDISYKELKNYYPEFINNKCEYDDCNHIKEDEKVCDVKKNVLLNNIDKGRYDRYTYIYSKLKEKEDKKYK